MYPNVWNIKEILSISSGGSKSSSRSGSTSDHSSLTDSQFLFGSQFWPDQTQGLSQEMSLQSNNSQQNSQEVNEAKILTNYHKKPYLFRGDAKDKSEVQSFICSQTKGNLEKFEEDKRKAKEKSESEMLMSEFSQLKESMEHIKFSLSSIDGNTDSMKRVVVEAMDGFTKTFQGTVGSRQEGFARQLEAVLNKLNSQSEALREMEDREAKTVLEATTLDTCMRSLQRDMENLRAEQAREQCMMGEILSLLHALASAQRPAAPLTDSGVQTSPCPWERFCLVSEEKRYFQGLWPHTGSAPWPPGYIAPPHGNQESNQTCDPNPGPIASAEQDRAEAPADRADEMRGQKPYRTRSTMARKMGAQDGSADTRMQDLQPCSWPDAQRRTGQSPGLQTKADGVVQKASRVTEEACRWKGAVRRRQRTWPPKRRKRGRGVGASTVQERDHAAMLKIPTSCKSTADSTPENPGTRFNPCDGWSQDSNAIQFVAGCEKTMASWVIPLSEPKTRITHKGFWQLFDFCDDSD
ncbi:hypothetical protein AAFF_G00145930 [Aldrovandia affinis]|uniref:Uncharacterized protein n=1 Tax=Aldrovandia affinis TaxID=143900 RepID=A0AAD7T2Q0_9TELE|nr:hypothetical protein AAFF_G00145930 [Aldrovandia affinis]